MYSDDDSLDGKDPHGFVREWRREQEKDLSLAREYFCRGGVYRHVLQHQASDYLKESLSDYCYDEEFAIKIITSNELAQNPTEACQALKILFEKSRIFDGVDQLDDTGLVKKLLEQPDCPDWLWSVFERKTSSRFSTEGGGGGVAESRGKTILHLASTELSAEMQKLIVDHPKCGSHLWTVKDESGMTPLHVAAKKRDTAFFSMLLDHPKCPSDVLVEKTDVGLSVLGVAADNNNEELIQLIFQHPKYPAGSWPISDVVAHCTFLASRGKGADVLPLLQHPKCPKEIWAVEHLANIFCKAAEQDETELISGMVNHPSCPKDLWSATVSIKYEYREHTHTALQIAARCHHAQTVSALINHPDCPKALWLIKDQSGNNILQLALMNKTDETDWLYQYIFSDRAEVLKQHLDCWAETIKALIDHPNCPEELWQPAKNGKIFPLDLNFSEKDHRGIVKMVLLHPKCPAFVWKSNDILHLLHKASVAGDTTCVLDILNHSRSDQKHWMVCGPKGENLLKLALDAKHAKTALAILQHPKYPESLWRTTEATHLFSAFARANDTESLLGLLASPTCPRSFWEANEEGLIHLLYKMVQSGDEQAVFPVLDHPHSTKALWLGSKRNHRGSEHNILQHAITCRIKIDEKAIREAEDYEEQETLREAAYQKAEMERNRIILRLLNHPNLPDEIFLSTGRDDKTILHVATEYGRVEAVKAILNHPKCPKELWTACVIQTEAPRAQSFSQRSFFAVRHRPVQSNKNVVEVIAQKGFCCEQRVVSSESHKYYIEMAMFILQHPKCPKVLWSNGAKDVFLMMASFADAKQLLALLNHPHFQKEYWLARNGDGKTALHLAAQYAQASDVILTLLDHPNCPKEYWSSDGVKILLHTAMRKVNTDIVMALLDHPNCPDALWLAQDQKGNNVLHIAVTEEEVIIKHFVPHPKRAIFKEVYKELSANKQVTKELIDQVKARCMKEIEEAMPAYREQCTHTLHALLNHERFPPSLWLSQNNDGMSILHLAIKQRAGITVGALLKHPSCPKALWPLQNNAGETILHMVDRMEEKGVFSVMLKPQYCPSEILLHRNKKGETSFLKAVSKGCIRQVLTLLHYPRFPKELWLIPDNLERTVLHAVCQQDAQGKWIFHEGVCLALLNHRSFPKDLWLKQDQNGDTVLHLVARANANVNVLLMHPSFPQALWSCGNKQGNTPLHLAVVNRNRQVRMDMLGHPDASSYLSLLNHQGKSPLDVERPVVVKKKVKTFWGGITTQRTSLHLVKISQALSNQLLSSVGLPDRDVSKSVATACKFKWFHLCHDHLDKVSDANWLSLVFRAFCFPTGKTVMSQIRDATKASKERLKTVRMHLLDEAIKTEADVVMIKVLNAKEAFFSATCEPKQFEGFLREAVTKHASRLSRWLMEKTFYTDEAWETALTACKQKKARFHEAISISRYCEHILSYLPNFDLLRLALTCKYFRLRFYPASKIPYLVRQHTFVQKDFPDASAVIEGEDTPDACQDHAQTGPDLPSFGAGGGAK